MTVGIYRNGSLLSEGELATVNPNDTEVCTRCGGTYYTDVHRATTCVSCWYAGAVEDAEARFKPLADALAERLPGVEPGVDQTGGMVMCLRVPLKDGKYAYFSELGEYAPGEMYAGVYRDTEEDTEDVDVLETWNSAWADRTIEARTWADDPGLCAEVADWAAPLLRRHL